MGRPPMHVKPTQIRLPKETRERIRALFGDTGMAAFIRRAIDRELKREEKLREAKKEA